MQEFISTLADAFGSYGDRNSAPCDGEIDTSLDYGVDNKNTSHNAVAAEFGITVLKVADHSRCV